MEPYLRRHKRRRSGWRNLWLGFWTALVLAGVACMAAPLLGNPSAAQGESATRPTNTASLPASGTPRGPGRAQRPLPIWLSAPDAAITGQIVPVGVDAHGNMAAPEGANSDPVWSEAFWWQYGVMPGQLGNAVIAGHLDRKDGSPAIFWKLNKLTVGDAVYVRTAPGRTLHFVVIAVKVFDNPTGGAADPVLQRIFGPASAANLNLITCSGDWTGTGYDKKLVVFTTLVP